MQKYNLSLFLRQKVKKNLHNSKFIYFCADLVTDTYSQ